MNNALHIGECRFDREKLFYPLVVQFLASLYGFVRLAERGTRNAINDRIAGHGITIEVAVQSLNETLREKLPVDPAAYIEPRSLFSPLALKSVHGSTAGVPLDQVAGAILDGGPVIIAKAMCQADGALLISAFERAKADHHYDETDPAWEFLRHCRNAYAHRNSFNFKGKEPKRPAEWRGLHIGRDLQGHRLLQEDPKDGSFLQPLDPLLLLSDLEAAHPNMAA